MSFSDAHVPEGDNTIALISINNTDNVPINEIQLFDAAGNKHVIDENDLTFDVIAADKATHDGDWTVVLTSGSTYPFNDTSDVEPLDVFSGCK